LIKLNFSKNFLILAALFIAAAFISWPLYFNNYAAPDTVSVHEFPKTVFIAYESPNRIYDTLAVFKEVAPTAMLCIARELTKKFEEVIRGTPEELLKREFKGEIVFLFKLTPL
jgi:16S rRNA C1402 (ribose-2'-O) methylase RsmI